MEVDVNMYEGEVLGISLPKNVELEVIETEPGLKGDTVSGGSKEATLETGLVVQVPLFINQGEKLNISTKDRKSTRLNSSHVAISYAVFCLKKKKNIYYQYMY